MSRVSRWSISGLLVTAVLGCGGLFVHRGVEAQTPSATTTPSAQAELQIGVVDFKQLIGNHPEYEKLKQMQDHIRQLEQEKQILPTLNLKKDQLHAQETMKRELDKAHSELEAERAAVESQMHGLSSALSGQMQAEVARMQAEANRTLQDYVKQVHPASAAPPPDMGGQDIKSYNENLALMVQRSLMARKLELDKAMSSTVEAERGKLDSQLAAYEDSVRGKYQEELVNLNLKVRLAKDEEEQKKLEERIRAIQGEIEGAKQAKRAESEGEFQKFYKGEKARFDSEMGAYKSRVDAEVRAKIGLPPVPKAHPTAAAQQGPPPEIKAKIQEMEARMKSQLASKQAELKARMEGEQRAAVDRLKGKQADIQARLKKVQQDLMDTMSSHSKFMDKETKAKMEKLEANLKKAKDEHKQLFLSMSGDISKAVGGVADKQKVPMVLGEVVYSNTGTIPDLTDLSMVAVKQLRK